jgi:uncharacterized protein YjbI with pentapeptide repeats
MQINLDSRKYSYQKNRIFCQTLIYGASLILSVFSSFLIGKFISIVFTIGDFGEKSDVKNILIFSYTLLSIYMFLNSMRNENFLIGIINNGLFLLVALLICAGLMLLLGIPGTLDFLPPMVFSEIVAFMVVTVISLTTCFSLSFVYAISNSPKKTYSYGLIVVLISSALAYMFSPNTEQVSGFDMRFVDIIVSSYIAFEASRISTKGLRSKRWPQLPAITHSWSVALCTFGNTSFHNKDLSHTDFTNADLANIDLRASRFDRTCFRGVTGLDRARLDNRYFDIDRPKVQQLLTQGTSTETDFNGLNLQGAYLKQAEMPNFALIGTNLTLADLSGGSLRNTNLSRANLSGADLTGADLQNSMLVQADLTGADLTGADLTGACIENWNINGRTNFSDVQCDYIYRKLDDTGKSTDRYPRDRNFERGEFTALYQEAENVAELFFKEGVNWRIFAFSLQKLQLEDEDLDLQLRTIEKRGDRWAITVTHNKNVPSELVERQLEAAYANLQPTFTAQEPKINQLLGIMSDQAKALSTQAEALNNQAEALKEFSKKNFGGLFYITGSTITNLTGSGQIEYTEAANQVRNLVANNTNNAQATQIAQQFLSQLQNQLAPTESEQAELIHQIILAEAAKDVLFRQFILQQSTTLLEVMPPGPITTAFQAALKTLQS